MRNAQSNEKAFYRLAEQSQENSAEIIRVEALPLIDFFDSLEALDFEFAISSMRTTCENFLSQRDLAYLISPTQVFGISVTVFANCLYHLAMP